MKINKEDNTKIMAKADDLSEDNKVEHEKILVADQDQVDDSAVSILSWHIEAFKELAK
ncbi:MULTISPECIES: hypothetical protein [unclassified Facklamia]|uniref:hypothetical protein n=1 Tax=Aerococcaceae TaxID=186827 RepID=UPI0013B797D4|nr:MULTISPECIES: hypothetical protein [unclassified Facklamia]NEW65212.1 hypothetical protein [Facklamia sp. 252]NEW68387.1 hypothetical protein [Facklamia sp. 253]QQD66205.1 hypothetical protein JDW14_03635 [Aerococcaceae bacterium zg-252]